MVVMRNLEFWMQKLWVCPRAMQLNRNIKTQANMRAHWKINVISMDM